jgi:hypothetical protein
MKNYTIRINKDNQHLIDITSLHPAPVEAFAFLPVQGGRIEVSTVDKARHDKWIEALTAQKCEFEIVA